mmetsp:Transcript_2122/g.3342  ORF Transcript_2122/g.3342 Transcript_2122/m.3342 type:complete len:423 (+) Transcript_2122:72-1340(+)
MRLRAITPIILQLIVCGERAAIGAANVVASRNVHSPAPGKLNLRLNAMLDRSSQQQSLGHRPRIFHATMRPRRKVRLPHRPANALGGDEESLPPSIYDMEGEGGETGGEQSTNMELHSIEIEGMPFMIARPNGIDDKILEIAAEGGDLDQYFWAFVWPAATALATDFRKRSSLVQGKSILEMGAGLGVAGITAALEGAKTVSLMDTKTDALQCALTTAQMNGLRVLGSEGIQGFTPEEMEAESQVNLSPEESGGNDSTEGNAAMPIPGSVEARRFEWSSMSLTDTFQDKKFDVVVLGDVFTGHVSALKKLQHQVPKMLAPGGCIIIAGGSLDVAELNFIGSLTGMGFSMEEVTKRTVQREYDVQMEDPGGNVVHLVRLREGGAKNSNDDGSAASAAQAQIKAMQDDDDDDLDEVDVEALLRS